ncbi:2Fe-2S iron-sulfur cluster-binding protein [soil metagenome]
MPKIHFIDYDGERRTVDATTGQNAMEAAVNADITQILGDCGGSLSCGTCHAYVDPDWRDRLPAPSRDEQDMLECTLEPRENSRLCCQLIITDKTDGLVIRLPEAQL